MKIIFASIFFLLVSDLSFAQQRRGATAQPAAPRQNRRIQDVQQAIAVTNERAFPECDQATRASLLAPEADGSGIRHGGSGVEATQ